MYIDFSNSICKTYRDSNVLLGGVLVLVWGRLGQKVRVVLGDNWVDFGQKHVRYWACVNLLQQIGFVSCLHLKKNGSKKRFKSLVISDFHKF